MKTKFSKLYLLALPAMLFMLSSCLKSSDRYIDFAEEAGSAVELPLSAYLPSTHAASATVYKVQVQSYKAQATPYDLTVVANYAAPDKAPADIKVTMAVDPDALATLKTKIGNTTYVLLPAAAYTIPTPTTTIASGTRQASIIVKINSAVIDKTVTTYILPISITDASGQTISKYKTIFYNVRATL